MFSGVTSSVDLDELEVMASEPVCLHLFLLDDFDEVEALTSAIEQRSCDGMSMYIGSDSYNENKINYLLFK